MLSHEKISYGRRISVSTLIQVNEPPAVHSLILQFLLPLA